MEGEVVEIHPAVIERYTVVGKSEVEAVHVGYDMHVLRQQASIEDKGIHRSIDTQATSKIAAETDHLIWDERRKHVHWHIYEIDVCVKSSIARRIVFSLKRENLYVIE